MHAQSPNFLTRAAKRRRATRAPRRTTCAVGDDVRGYTLVERVRFLGLPTLAALPPPAYGGGGGVVLATPPVCGAPESSASRGGDAPPRVCSPDAEAVAPADAAAGPGGYSLHASVGRGHAGEVWRATGPDGAACVLKRLLARSAPAVASGRREAFFGSRTIGQPGVARFVESFTADDGALWLVFADEGASLARLLYAAAAGGSGALAPAPFFVRLHTARVGRRVFREVASQLARALGALAGAGVAAHRDVKPGNVLLGVDAEGALRVVLCDFGSALPADADALRALYPPPAGASAAEATLAYAPPETRLSLDGRAVDAGAPGAAYDAWSLGVTLLEVLLGAPPGEALAAGAVLGERDAAIVRARLDAELGPEGAGAGAGAGGGAGEGGAPPRDAGGAAARSGGWAPLRPRAAAGVLVDLLALCIGPRVPPGADAAAPPADLPRAAAAAWPAAVRALAAADHGRAWAPACLDDRAAFVARVRRVVARASARARAAARDARKAPRAARGSGRRGDGDGDDGSGGGGSDGAVAAVGGQRAGAGAGGGTNDKADAAAATAVSSGLTTLPDAAPAGALPPPPSPPPVRLINAAAGRALVAAFGAAAGGALLELAPPPPSERAEALVAPLGDVGVGAGGARGRGGRRDGARARRRAAEGRAGGHDGGAPAGADGPADGDAGGRRDGAWALGDEGEALLYGLLRWRAADRLLPAAAAEAAFLADAGEARDDGDGVGTHAMGGG